MRVAHEEWDVGNGKGEALGGSNCSRSPDIVRTWGNLEPQEKKGRDWDATSMEAGGRDLECFAEKEIDGKENVYTLKAMFIFYTDLRFAFTTLHACIAENI